MEWLKLRERLASGWSQWFRVLITGVMVGVFGGLFLQAQPALALEATWNGDTLVSGGLQFKLVTDVERKKELLRLPSDTVFEAKKQILVTTPPKEEIHVIYFDPGVRVETAKEATYVVYDVNPDLSRPVQRGRPEKATFPPKTPEDIAQSGDCVAGGAMGWLFCPLSNVLASSIDWIYGEITKLMRVAPLDTNDPKSGARVTWEIMRTFANLAFIIAFLIIIYSQITSVGISNYGIKRLVPRVVVAAVMVNLSFIICAFVIDLSNMLGVALQDMMMEVRKEVLANGSFKDIPLTWGDIVTVVSAGGGAAVGGRSLAGASGLVLSSALPWLLVVLVAVILTLVAVFIILAARQALIILLIVVSPLAFVCYLLPGTEKWFDKWKDSLLVMAIFFPAFSLVFGGAQLASMVILQNPSSLMMVVLGLAIQVAPLAIAPLVLKLSGGVLGKFAGMVNDKNRGLLDRTRNFARDWSKQIASKRSLGKQDHQLGKKNFLRRAGRNIHYRQRRFKEATQNAESAIEAAYEGSPLHAAEDRRRRDIEQNKTLAQKRLDVAWNEHVRSDEAASARDLRIRTVSSRAEEAAKRLDARFEDFRTGKDRVSTDKMMLDLQRDAMHAQDLLALTEQRIAMARSDQEQRIANRLTQNSITILDNEGNPVKYREYAGGIAGPSGAAAALASAIAARNKAHDEGIKEATVIQSHFKLTGEQRDMLVRGMEVKVTDGAGKVLHTFTGSDAATQTAAAIENMRIGTYQQKMTAVLNTNPTAFGDDPKTGETVHFGLTAAIRGAVAEAAAANGIAKTAIFLGGKTLEDTNQGTMTLESAIFQTISRGKFKESDLSSNDVEALRAMFQFDGEGYPASAAERAEFRRGREGLMGAAWNILHTPMLRANASDAAIRYLEEVTKGYIPPRETPTP